MTKRSRNIYYLGVNERFFHRRVQATSRMRAASTFLFFFFFPHVSFVAFDSDVLVVLSLDESPISVASIGCKMYIGCLQDVRRLSATTQKYCFYETYLCVQLKVYRAAKFVTRSHLPTVPHWRCTNDRSSISLSAAVVWLECTAKFAASWYSVRATSSLSAHY